MSSRGSARKEGKRTPTLRDVAERSGFSIMTVSRAIRNSPGVDPETKKRVQEAAEALSYRPNPIMAALASYRTRIKGPSGYSQIAFVTNFPTRDGWKKWPWITSYFEGAKERGAESGYDVVDFWLRENGMTQKRASMVLFNRGIKGLLLAPTPPGTLLPHFNLKWENFSTLTLGFTIPKPPLTSVLYDRHAAGLTACHHLRRLGFRRVGLAVWRGSSIGLMHTLVDAFLGEQMRYPREMGNIPPLIWSHFEYGDFLNWFTAHRPDVLLTHAEGPLEESIRQLPKAEWRKTPVVYTAINESHPPHWPGVRSDIRQAGAIALNQLNGLLVSGQLGIHPPRTVCMIHGTWQAPKDFGKSR